MKGEDLKQVAANGSGDSSGTEGIVDSTTDVVPKQEPSSDNPESDNVTEGPAGNGQAGGPGGKGPKTGKNIKKNALKGKKKSNQKTDSPAKCEDLKASESNGPVSENNGATTGINKTKVTL